MSGASHHRQAILLALGEKVEMPEPGGGHSPVAAKFMIRSNEEDGIIREVPSEEQIDELKALFPDLFAQILVRPGERLSNLPDQDSYTYELADLFIGGADIGTIEDAYLRCRHALDFLIKPIPEEL